MANNLLARDEFGKPIVVDSDNVLADDAGVSQLGTTKVTGILEVDGQTIIDASGAGESVEIDGNVDIQGKFIDGVEIDLQDDDTESFQVRTATAGPVALRIIGSDVTSATNLQGQSTIIQMTHLPTFANTANAQADATIPVGAIYVVGDQIHIKT